MTYRIEDANAFVITTLDNHGATDCRIDTARTDSEGWTIEFTATFPASGHTWHHRMLVRVEDGNLIGRVQH